VVLPSGVTAYDLSRTHQPVAVAHSALREVSGVLSTGNQILAWGREGIFALELDLESGKIRTDQSSRATTLAMTRVGQRVFALSCDRVEV
jgi:hypothetical protein